MIASVLPSDPLPSAALAIDHVAGRPWVLVCAWHTPLAELLALSRQFPGAVSHALCPTCAARFEQAVR